MGEVLSWKVFLNMPHTSGMAVKVGIFVVIGLILLIGFSLRVEQNGLRGETYQVDAYFKNALGLEVGSEVSLHGVRVGRVDELGFDPARKAVRARLTMSSEYPLPNDSKASVERSALLGSSFIVVDYGDGRQMLANGGELPTEERPGLDQLIAAVTEASEDARELMATYQEGGDDLFNRINEVIEENRAQFKETSDAFASAGPKLDALAERLNEFANDIAEGKGTIGKLFADDGLYNDLNALSKDLQELVADARTNEEGTLYKLIYDDTLITRAEEGFQNLSKAGKEIQTLLADRRDEIDSFLASLSDVGPRIEEATRNFNEIAAKVNEGEGTLGRLVNDPSLYEDAQKAVNQVGESFEASEEQGVIRSFVGVLFGALI
jgi:phospholipid/cholesterol/gamma-HCH transport system substrate-binding protein